MDAIAARNLIFTEPFLEHFQRFDPRRKFGRFRQQYGDTILDWISQAARFADEAVVLGINPKF
jgi:hypothetical protein